MPETPPRGLPLRVAGGQAKKGAGARHGLHCWVDSKRVPGGRAFQAVRRELAQKRAELIAQNGGLDKIRPDAAILIDSVIEGLGVSKLIGLFIRRYGPIDVTAATKGRLEAQPVLAKSWVAYQNLIRQGLLALRELSRDGHGQGDEPIDVLTLVAQVEEFEGRAAGQEPDPEGEDGPGRPPEGRAAPARNGGDG